ncbi:hypothetical protein GUJ93_ZPchr0006g44736 [Zizania palustris]|uniref:Uncharacterized protein n=1 Tax=Zizania palustris TaxID=103762 RepID=A0A8J5S7D5_ZIZPA|nr:hypothetical protein GUJ93_ZPchr0006g44736 [Zizania palustris]
MAEYQEVTSPTVKNRPFAKPLMPPSDGVAPPFAVIAARLGGSGGRRRGWEAGEAGGGGGTPGRRWEAGEAGGGGGRLERRAEAAAAGVVTRRRRRGRG